MKHYDKFWIVGLISFAIYNLIGIVIALIWANYSDMVHLTYWERAGIIFGGYYSVTIIGILFIGCLGWISEV